MTNHTMTHITDVTPLPDNTPITIVNVAHIVFVYHDDPVTQRNAEILLESGDIERLQPGKDLMDTLVELALMEDAGEIPLSTIYKLNDPDAALMLWGE